MVRQEQSIKTVNCASVGGAFYEVPPAKQLTKPTTDSAVLKAHRAASGANKGEGAKSDSRRQPERPDHKNPRGCRQQRSTAQLHRNRRTGPRQPSHGRNTDHASIAAGDHCRQGRLRRVPHPDGKIGNRLGQFAMSTNADLWALQQ
jgi:hypothetical protein